MTGYVGLTQLKEAAWSGEGITDPYPLPSPFPPLPLSFFPPLPVCKTTIAAGCQKKFLHRILRYRHADRVE